MDPLKNKHQKSYQNAKTCYICKKKFEDKHARDRKYRKNFKHIVIMQGDIEVLHIVYLISSMLYLRNSYSSNYNSLFAEF